MWGNVMLKNSTWQFCLQLAASVAGFEWNWWSVCHACHLESFLVWYTTEDSFIICNACGKKWGGGSEAWKSWSLKSGGEAWA